MSTAVAAPPATTTAALNRSLSPRRFASLLPTTASAPPAIAPVPPAPPRSRPRSNGSASSGEQRTSEERSSAAGPSRVSPSTLRTAAPPMIKVKKEPGSPSMASARPRPKRLDLSSSTASRGPQTARPSAPLTSRDSAGLGIQTAGLACLSPGFQTQDPALREQLQRSLDVRDQQRQIIEARQKGVKPGSALDNGEASARVQDTTLFGVQTRTPQTSRRKGPPPGLSINAPSASHFSNDRVIQSAPLHQTFTGLQPHEHPYTRHSQLGPSALGQTSHIHHVPATQTNNRLPPIADVFANDRLDAPRFTGNSPSNSSDTRPPVPSPGFPPRHDHLAAPLSSRSREFRSADEAVHSLSGGRDDLMPKVVHYRGVQPPTPPSPMPTAHRLAANAGPGTTAPAPNGYGEAAQSTARPDILDRTASMNGRRRGRDEYERDNGSPPSVFNRSEPKRAAFAVRGDESREEDWKTGLSDSGKKQEFLKLCERAWDLLHS